MSDGVWANKLNYPATQQQIALPEAIDSLCLLLTDREGFSFCRLMFVHLCRNLKDRAAGARRPTEECRHFREFSPFEVQARHVLRTLPTQPPNTCTNMHLVGPFVGFWGFQAVEARWKCWSGTAEVIDIRLGSAFGIN